jgi:exportin-2 (importin alpha re-exporter)
MNGSDCPPSHRIPSYPIVSHRRSFGLFYDGVNENFAPSGCPATCALDRWLASWYTARRALLLRGALPTPSSQSTTRQSTTRQSTTRQVQAAVCENLELYMQKYEEEFGKYLPTFVPLVWQLLVAKGSQARYDILVTTCIKFLTSVSMSVHHSVFESPATLEQICTHIVIPNIKFREEDEELFEDDPQEYIRRDIEGSDTDTRRRVACELVKGLRKYYEGPVTEIFGKHVVELLGQHAASPATAWQAKDAAVYIVTSLAVKTSTAREGTTSTNELVNIVDFFQTNTKPFFQTNTEST